MFSFKRIVRNIRRTVRFILLFDNWFSYPLFKLSARREHFSFSLRGLFKIDITKALISRFLETFLNGRYLHPFDREIKNLREPVILDIGAGGGWFSLYVLSQFPRARVLAFEVNKSQYVLLHKCWQAYQHSSFSIINERVWLNDGLMVENGESPHPGLIRSSRLTMIRRKYQLRKIHLLKLTCGSDAYDILYSMPERGFLTIERIVLDLPEIDQLARNRESMIAFLSNYGYQIHKENQTINNDNGLIQAYRAQKSNTVSSFALQKLTDQTKK